MIHLGISSMSCLCAMVSLHWLIHFIGQLVWQGLLALQCWLNIAFQCVRVTANCYLLALYNRAILTTFFKIRTLPVLMGAALFFLGCSAVYGVIREGPSGQPYVGSVINFDQVQQQGNVFKKDLVVDWIQAQQQGNYGNKASGATDTGGEVRIPMEPLDEQQSGDKASDKHPPITAKNCPDICYKSLITCFAWMKHLKQNVYWSCGWDCCGPRFRRRSSDEEFSKKN